MSDKLVKAAAGLLDKRVDPQIESTACPERDWLMDARAVINGHEEVSALFQTYVAEELTAEWLVDNLTIRLVARWGTDHETEAREAAQFLADEYIQVGEGIHLVSTETGRIAITLTDEDIYQPAPIPREDGSMAIPLPRMRPDLESALVTWTFEKGREERIVATLAARGHQTALLREEGDPRLLVATRTGRSEIVRSLTDFTPKALLGRLGGTSAVFLRHFDICTTEPGKDVTEALSALEGYISARSVMNVADQTTVNLHHSRQQTLRGALPQGWVREIAKRLSLHLHRERKVEPEERFLGAWAKNLLSLADFWVAPPELVMPLRRIAPKATALPATQAKLIGFRKPKLGYLVVPESFEAASHELFERWEAVADLEFKLWFDPTAICHLAARVEYQGVVE